MLMRLPSDIYHITSSLLGLIFDKKVMIQCFSLDARQGSHRSMKQEMVHCLIRTHCPRARVDSKVTLLKREDYIHSTTEPSESRYVQVDSEAGVCVCCELINTLRSLEAWNNPSRSDCYTVFVPKCNLLTCCLPCTSVGPVSAWGGEGEHALVWGY